MTQVPEQVPTPLEVAPDLAPLGGVEPDVEVVVVLDDVVPDPEPRTPAEIVAAAVLGVPGVVRLHGGRFGELGTYLPGRRVTGVRIDDDGTEVHVVVDDLAPVPETAARVQRAVSAVAPMPVRVHVEDIDTIV
ncbi:Asp23/Gls24 family envelope stress response protein [Cellulomonas xylanilytica]|uniref:Asp23/Gls24 family envelope stress response protein n=1 Tax=Cellulomonas xylanilytica TaxID=233583 RepID=A0A510VA31_9CELL|nr:Asp23/Gls24 family envelope stress response protein [Cellulomonas xylanilytica]GEK22025.1 hypothetical protein CXY01_25450 [Cellulomonas xylanilytica]